MSDTDKNLFPQGEGPEMPRPGQEGEAPVADTATGNGNPTPRHLKKHIIRPKWLRIILKTCMWLIIAVALIPVLLYVPPVQTLVKNIACNMVYKSTGMKIEIGQFRLKWPVDVSLKDVTVLEASGDTMASVREALVDVKMKPLLSLDVKINRLLLTDGYYRMVSPDSSMILKVRAGMLETDDKSSANIAESRIILHKAKLKKGSLDLFMNVWKQKPSPQDSTSVPFVISANDILLEDFRFSMSMLPTIDTLMLHTDRLQLRNGVVDLGKNMVTADYLGTRQGSVTYLTPTPEYIETHPAPVQDSISSSPSAPMIIKGDTVELSGFKALYAVKGATPLPGFDPSYIEVNDVSVRLTDFYNAASTIRLPIAAISASERSGLRIMEGNGTIAVDSTGLALHDVQLLTPYSSLKATAGIPFALMTLQPSAPLNARAEGHIGMPDVEAFMPSLSQYTSKIPGRSPLKFDLSASGTLSDVDIPNLLLEMPGIFMVSANGKAKNALDIKNLVADLSFDGKVENPRVIDNLMGNVGFRLPSLDLRGEASAFHENYEADFRLLTSAGDLAARGNVALNSETYSAAVKVNRLNVGHFMPTLGIGQVTATLEAAGSGFNPTKPKAATDLKIDILSLIYQKKELRDITADVSLHNGQYTLSAVSSNTGAKFTLEGEGTVAPDLYTFNIHGELDDIDLMALGVSPTPNHGKGTLALEGSASPEKWLYDARMKIDSLEWTAGNQYFRVPGTLAANFKATGDRVAATLDARMANLDFDAASGLQNLVTRFSEVADSVNRQIAARNLDVEGLQQALPSFRLAFNASGRGILGEYLHTMGMNVDTIYAHLANDSLISGEVKAIGLGNKSMRADTLSLRMQQRGKLLDYFTHMGNRSNNPLSDFADVNLNGYVGSNRLLLSVTQKNQKGDTGYRLGMTGAITDSIISMHFTPLRATIAYLPWKFNDDNHIDFNILNKRVDANLQASSNESSITMQTRQGEEGNDELHLVLDNIHIQDFLQMSVFAPPLTASVDADLKVGYTKNWLYGGGTVGVSDFTYDKLRVGDFDLGIRAGRNDDGSTGARIDMKIDNQEALLAKVMLVPDSLGALTPKKLGLELTRFPVAIANPFLGADVARLSGYLNGALDMSGSFSSPILDGHLACDSLNVYVPMIGSTLRLGQDSVKVARNVLRLDNFDIYGANSNPLVLNGSVDASNLSALMFNLKANATNFQLMGNDKNAKSEIYGKVFMDMKASFAGPMSHVNLNANVNVLPSTDVTYSVSQTTAQLQQQDASGVVKFVNFNDTTTVASADSVAQSMSMRIVAALSLQPGMKVKVDIPGTAATGNGKVELSPSGTLNYFQNYMGDMRLSGQLYLGNGFAAYTIPLAGQKKFEFNPESYVLWNGELMNPVLSINATDNIKANLLQNGNSRMVNFLVKLSVSNTLAQPKVVFDLSTEDDMTVENELMSMSPDQRSMAAINLLLTGQYSGQGVKTASSDMMQGALYGALTSQINNWMANNVKGVDLSFGVDQYNKTVNGETGNAMSYSYTMSKSLFDNRFKISVGGNYSTDASADENFSENLISDISFEYILKQTANSSMYLRLFRHTGYESILEGEITETGVGFVMKRRLSNLKELFKLSTWRPKADADSVPPAYNPDKDQTTPLPVAPKQTESTDSIDATRVIPIEKTDSTVIKKEDDYEK